MSRLEREWDLFCLRFGLLLVFCICFPLSIFVWIYDSWYNCVGRGFIRQMQEAWEECK